MLLRWARPRVALKFRAVEVDPATVTPADYLAASAQAIQCAYGHREHVGGVLLRVPDPLRPGKGRRNEANRSVVHPTRLPRPLRRAAPFSAYSLQREQAVQVAEGLASELQVDVLITTGRHDVRVAENRGDDVGVDASLEQQGGGRATHGVDLDIGTSARPRASAHASRSARSEMGVMFSDTHTRSHGLAGALALYTCRIAASGAGSGIMRCDFAVFCRVSAAPRQSGRCSKPGRTSNGFGSSAAAPGFQRQPFQLPGQV